jgi:hypothetical protein
VENRLATANVIAERLRMRLEAIESWDGAFTPAIADDTQHAPRTS